MEEQPGREFASADPTAGAQDATFQERPLCVRGRDASYPAPPAQIRTGPIVDGGLNPRLSGGGAETGTNFAAEFLAARVRGDRSLSTPQAAGGGGQRPAFTGIYRPAKISRRDRWRWQHRIFSYPEYSAIRLAGRRISADSHRRQQPHS